VEEERGVYCKEEDWDRGCEEGQEGGEGDRDAEERPAEILAAGLRAREKAEGAWERRRESCAVYTVGGAAGIVAGFADE